MPSNGQTLWLTAAEARNRLDSSAKLASMGEARAASDGMEFMAPQEYARPARQSDGQGAAN